MAINDITKLAQPYLEAKAATWAHFRTKPDPFDLDNEDHIRWQIKYDRLINQQVRLEPPYRAACDKFFSAVETVETA